MIFLSFGIILKNISRIGEEYRFDYLDYPWPKKNSSNITNYKNKNIVIKKDNDFLYFFSPVQLCYYNQSPCTHIPNLKIKKTRYLNFYDKYIIDNRD